jgi:hypothetical protein
MSNGKCSRAAADAAAQLVRPLWPAASSFDSLAKWEEQFSTRKIIDDIFDSSDDDSDDEITVQQLEEIRRIRLHRRAAAYCYSGDLLRCIENRHAQENMNWESLPSGEVERRWMAEFRMTEPVFIELFELVPPHMEDSVPANPLMRAYSVKEKLLFTLNFLAHCPTLRQMASKWAMPHNSIAVVCLHPTVRVLRTVFVEDPATKNMRWPKTDEDQKRVMDGFKRACKIPGCLGAIDGSLIPMRKPTKEAANQDSDSYYGYKGFIASLLLAVCDADMLFTYINAGAPACVGDAGLFGRTRLREQINEGLMRTMSVPLFFDDGTRQDMWPYIVGDAAFPFGQHMMKAYDPPPAQGTPEATCNKRILHARRVIERAYGRLKGRWVFCKKNTFWNDLQFSRSAIEVCCGLHNFLEVRNVGMPEEDDDNEENVVHPLPHEVAQDAGDGATVRNILTAWVADH